MVDVSSGVESAPGVKSRKPDRGFCRGGQTNGARVNTLPNSLRSGPDATGHFGAYGGRFVAETLMPLLLELEKAYEAAKQDPSFQARARRTA